MRISRLTIQLLRACEVPIGSSNFLHRKLSCYILTVLEGIHFEIVEDSRVWGIRCRKDMFSILTYTSESFTGIGTARMASLR